MSKPKKLPRYTLGVGDRFAHEAKSQLASCLEAAAEGVEVIPVWNKSNREHTIIGSEPAEARAAADAAVNELGWKKPYFVDADHISLKTVDRFLEPCDFFTLDVAESIGKRAAPEAVEEFVARHPEFSGKLELPSVPEIFVVDEAFVIQTAEKFLAAVQEAGAIYRHIAEHKKHQDFVTEISMDETDAPQTPVELTIILAAIADEAIPIQTIAPKFTGRFNKGVDYDGNAEQFGKEFNEDIAAIAFCIERYGLPGNLKLSVHSGSDKFSIYPFIHRAIEETGAGVHVKTAGTTWLEELTGLAESGGVGLAFAKEIYAGAYNQAEELCAPYASVIAIKRTELPTPTQVRTWSSEEYVMAVEHDPHNPHFNASVRQLLHVGFKVAAKMGTRFLEALDLNEAIVSERVRRNLFDKHIRPIFIGR